MPAERCGTLLRRSVPTRTGGSTSTAPPLAPAATRAMGNGPCRLPDNSDVVRGRVRVEALREARVQGGRECPRDAGSLDDVPPGSTRVRLGNKRDRLGPLRAFLHAVVWWWEPRAEA